MSSARVPSPGVGCAGSFTLFRLPSDLGDLAALRQLAGEVGGAFRSRLVAADFARGRDGRWWFIEAGPGSCAGTAHDAAFKAVARRLRGEKVELRADAVGGPL